MGDNTSPLAGKTVGVIGLGNMGSGMVQSLLRNGAKVVAFDVAKSARERAAAYGGQITVVTDVGQVWSEARVVMLSLPRPEHVQEVVAGDQGLLSSPEKPTLVIDLSTNSPTLTKDLHARLTEKGHQLVDAPVSGGASGAAAGTLSVMVGGDSSAIDAAKPFINAVGSTVKVIGGSGTGQIAKLVNNILTAANRVAAGEAFFVGEKAGVPVADLVEIVNASSGGSRVTQLNYPKHVLTGTFQSGMTMGLLGKDISLMLDLAKQHGADVPVLEALVKRWAVLQDHHGYDSCAMTSTQIAGLQPPT